jgi:hypothetical protein
LGIQLDFDGSDLKTLLRIQSVEFISVCVGFLEILSVLFEGFLNRCTAAIQFPNLKHGDRQTMATFRLMARHEIEMGRTFQSGPSFQRPILLNAETDSVRHHQAA